MAMIFEAAEPIVQFVGHLTRLDEDSVDRLHHKYSTILFCLLAIVVTTNQFVGEPIKCWTPAEFQSSWTDYVNSICWISNTYYIPMSNLDIINSPKKEVVYYQWIPLALFLQAFIFYLPFLFWSVFSDSIGIDMHKVANLLRQADQMNPSSRDICTRFLSKQVDRALLYNRHSGRGLCGRIRHNMAQWGCMIGKQHGNFLIFVYLITKLLYLIVTVLQLYLLQYFLDTKYDFYKYGVDVLQDIIDRGVFEESRRFPRVTLCDFEVRSLGRNLPYSVQCALPVNIFNEKLYIFVWFWLAMLSIVNIVSIIYWLWVLFATNRRHYFKKCLKVQEKYNRQDDWLKLRGFCDYYLRYDGYFVLRMISKNTNDVVAGEIIAALWEKYCKSVPTKTRENDYNV